jgi:hypothetical protein
MPDDKPRLTEDEQRQYVEALETLPLLTRTVFLLASRDRFPYAEIGWRCGISIDEVQVRVADALLGLDRHMRVQPTFTGRIRRALLPWRDAWATARAREGDRRLAPWLSPGNRPGSRGAIDWIAWAFEHTLR